MCEQPFKVDFNHERQKHQARLKEEALATTAKLKTPQCAFVILAALLEDSIRYRHRSSIANPILHPSENRFGNTGLHIKEADHK